MILCWISFCSNNVIFHRPFIEHFHYASPCNLWKHLGTQHSRAGTDQWRIDGNADGILFQMPMETMMDCLTLIFLVVSLWSLFPDVYVLITAPSGCDKNHDLHGNERHTLHIAYISSIHNKEIHLVKARINRLLGCCFSFPSMTTTKIDYCPVY